MPLLVASIEKSPLAVGGHHHAARGPGDAAADPQADALLDLLVPVQGRLVHQSEGAILKSGHACLLLDTAAE
jgi:hypothetical protein